jgi:hypothetical protein
MKWEGRAELIVVLTASGEGDEETGETVLNELLDMIHIDYKGVKADIEWELETDQYSPDIEIEVMEDEEEDAI